MGFTGSVGGGVGSGGAEAVLDVGYETIQVKVVCLGWLSGGSVSIEGSLWLGESVVVVGCSTRGRGARGGHF